MKTLIRLEEAGLFLFSIYLFSTLDFAWWYFPLLLLVPDISMLGYAGSTRIGAFVYNLIHFRALGLALYLSGLAFSMPILALAGIILFAHSTIDRVFGFGLKYGDSFKSTHLGSIDDNKQKVSPGK
jgi:hypothetical protein